MALRFAVCGFDAVAVFVAVFIFSSFVPQPQPQPQTATQPDSVFTIWTATANTTATTAKKTEMEITNQPRLTKRVLPQLKHDQKPQ